VGDVANAAQLGADAVMLSGETATGLFPVPSVAVMDKVLREIEQSQWRAGHFAGDITVEKRKEKHSVRQAVANATLELARDLRLNAIIIPTMTGTTARIIAAYRPIASALGVCADAHICRRMALHWGVVPVHVKESETHDWRRLCEVIAKQCDLTKKGRHVLIAAGFSNIPNKSEPVLKYLQL
jgi:pyruvate kinase